MYIFLKTLYNRIMNKRYKKTIVIIILILISILMVSCTKVVVEETVKEGFEIYLATVKSVQEFGFFDYENLVLLEEPIITNEDVRAYYWQNHEIEVTSTYTEKAMNSSTDQNALYVDNGSFRQYEKGGSAILNTFQYDCFVIVVNGEPIYSGTFSYSPIFSYSQEELIIADVSDTSFKIIYTGEGLDPRKADSIYEYFFNNEKLQVNDVNNLEGRIEELEENINNLIDEKQLITVDRDILNEELKKTQEESEYYESTTEWLKERIYWFMVETEEDEVAISYSNYLLGLDQFSVDSITKASNKYRENVYNNTWDNDRLFNIFETYYYSVINNLETSLTTHDITEEMIMIGKDNGINFSVVSDVITITPIEGYMIKNFGSYLSRSTKEYLGILDYELSILNQANAHSLIEGSRLTIPLNDLADIVVKWEIYSYEYGYKRANMPFRFKGSEKLLSYFNIYSGKVFLEKTPAYDENKILSEDYKNSFNYMITTYPDSITGTLITELNSMLIENEFIRDINIEEFYIKGKFDLLF